MKGETFRDFVKNWNDYNWVDFEGMEKNKINNKNIKEKGFLSLYITLELHTPEEYYDIVYGTGKKGKKGPKKPVKKGPKPPKKK